MLILGKIERRCIFETIRFVMFVCTKWCFYVLWNIALKIIKKNNNNINIYTWGWRVWRSMNHCDLKYIWIKKEQELTSLCTFKNVFLPDSLWWLWRDSLWSCDASFFISSTPSNREEKIIFSPQIPDPLTIWCDMKINDTIFIRVLLFH